ncbi:UNVERIFIED_CONTAM: hypothetical protein GTU68_021882 [Idotea baltica]|nr:hypothetical protein [Idotea baltica]
MLIYVDLHIMNEYTSPQAFSGLDTKQLSVWQSEAHLAVVDHVNPTRSSEPHDAASKLLIDNLESNCLKHGIAFYGLGDKRQGIEHVVVPEQGLAAPGMLIACGDSHTTTYGAFGALGFGIGTSEVEHVLATQTKIDASEIAPLVSWGTSPDQSMPIDGSVPKFSSQSTPKTKAAMERALEYMGLTPGQSMQDISIDTAFIGSCTNGRIEDLRAAAHILEGRKVANGVKAVVVPGSAITGIQAMAEGLDKVFTDAGFEWRPESGCSMCLAMNDDIAMDGERVASSTNRNFEGRQGRGARTHLMSPAMVAAAAVAGHLADVRDFELDTE